MLTCYDFFIGGKWVNLSRKEAIGTLKCFFGYDGCAGMPEEVQEFLDEAEANTGEEYKIGSWNLFRVVIRHQRELITQ